MIKRPIFSVSCFNSEALALPHTPHDESSLIQNDEIIYRCRVEAGRDDEAVNG